MKTLSKIILILAVTIAILVTKAYPQALSVGIGYSSEGLTAAMFTAEYKCHVLYFKSIQDCVTASEEKPGYIEKHEYVFGYGLRVHNNVTLLMGAGRYQNRTVFEYQYGNGFKKGLKMGSFEYGFRWDFISMNKKKFEHINITLTGLMSTYTGVSAMVGIRYRF